MASKKIGGIYRANTDLVKKKVVAAIESSGRESKFFQWQTPSKISKITNIPAQVIVQTIENNGDFILAADQNERGEALFSLRKTYLEKASLTNKILSVLTNKVI